MIPPGVQGPAALVLIIGGLMMASLAQAQSRLEVAVKANYLVRFAAFVEWPSRAFERPDAPLLICVAGRDPFGAALSQAASGQTAHGRPLQIRTGVEAAGASGCHILYLGAGADAALTTPAGTFATLTVSDAAARTRGGMLHFVIQASRVRFHVDVAAARARGLSISSRLLALGVSVRGA